MLKFIIKFFFSLFIILKRKLKYFWFSPNNELMQILIIFENLVLIFIINKFFTFNY